MHVSVDSGIVQIFACIHLT